MLVLLDSTVSHAANGTSLPCPPPLDLLIPFITREANALFIMIGADAQTQWLPTSLERDANGYICTGRDIQAWRLSREPFALETSIPGLFCAGDVRYGSGKRVASGVGEGSMAVAYIHQFLALNNRAPVTSTQ